MSSELITGLMAAFATAGMALASPVETSLRPKARPGGSTEVTAVADTQATVYAGGWSDYRAQRAEAAPVAAEPAKPRGKPAQPGAPKPAAPKSKPKLSFTEKHRLEELPGVIERLEAEIAKLEGLLSDAELFTREPEKFRKATDALTKRQAALSEAEEEWLELAEKAEA